MPINYDFKTAKDLIDKLQKKINVVGESKKALDINTTNLYKLVSNLSSSSYFSNYIDYYFNNGSFLDDDNIQRLIFLTYKAAYNLYICDECNKLGTKFIVDITRASDKIKICNNPLKWLFANKDKKKNAEDAYELLLEYSDSKVIKKIDEIILELNKLTIADYELASIEFNNDKKAMLETLEQNYNKVFTTNGRVKLFDKYITDYDVINDKIESIKKTYNKLVANVKKYVDSYIAEELVNSLRSISVDELSRSKSGIRIKNLKDAGYETMADVYSATHYELVSIYGISEDSAYTIEDVCDDYARNIVKGLKIKLNYDNQNKISTNLIESIHKYLSFIELKNEFDYLYEDIGSKLEKSINDIKSVGNGFKCLFMTQKQIETLKESYIYVNNYLYSNYKEKLDNIYKLYRSSNKKEKVTDIWEDFSINSIKYYNVLEELCPGVLGNEDSIYGLPKELARQIQDECFFPDGLLCTLRKYQEWGVKYALHQEKVLLGDEMGLGKTIQAIATMVSLKNTGATHFLVICPASVVTNWCREIVKHSKLKAIKIHGRGKKEAFNSWVKNGGVAVTNFESTSIIKLDDNFRYTMLVVDEAHYIKNSAALRTINTINISKKADRLLFMTGTALENNVDEMISLLNILQPNIATEISQFAFMASAPQFREKIAPVYYRRKREDVLTELPDKIESEEWCTLNSLEEELYEEAVLDKRYNDARRVSWNIEDLNKSSKALRLKEIVEEARLEGRKVIVFSFFLDTIHKIHSFLRGKCLNPINGSVNTNRRQEIIDQFDNSPAGTVLLAQITSGGTGLNIQSASVVVICEPQFKPSIENQAISRAYRMGQTRNVLVYRLLCEGTIDEKLMDVLKEKQRVFDAFADKSVAAEQTLDIDDKKFGEIINEEIERINEKRRNENLIESKEEVIEENNGDTKDEDFLVDDPILNKRIKVDYVLYDNLNKLKGKKYYESIIKFSYYELVQYLLYKYGHAKYDYFSAETCKTKNRKVSRTNEGLFCHHIDEDKAIMLSEDTHASENPFRYQKADRLVYCNYLEHLLLHTLIFEELRNKKGNKLEINGLGGAVCYICKQINDYYNGYNYKQEYLINTSSVIKDDYSSYILILNRLWKDIKRKGLDIFIDKEELAMGWYGNVYDNILKELN